MHGWGGCPLIRTLRVWSPLPYRSATLDGHGLLAVGILLRSLCGNVLVRPTRISPRQKGGRRAAKYPSGVHGKARVVGYVLQSAAPTGPSP